MAVAPKPPAQQPVTKTLERELAFWEANKAKLLADHSGRFALIHGDRLLGVFTRFEEAFEAGVGELGNQPFLIMPIVDEPPTVQYPSLVAGMTSARS